MNADQEFGTPVVNVHKRTTKVNIAAVVAVLVFFAIGAAVIVWYSHRS